MIKIEKALNSWLVGMNLVDPIHWQNVKHEPNIRSPFYEVFWLPSVIDPVSIGVGGFDESLGIYQIDVKVPLDSGTGALTRLCEAILDRFQNGTRIHYDGRSVLVLSQSLSPGTIDGTMLKRSISINYSSMCQRRIL